MQAGQRFARPCGHTVLQAIAERLRHCVGEKDFVARFGGDEFASCKMQFRLSRNLPDGTMISPSEFVPVAERTGAIVEIRGVGS
ncbi:diguanylate cyclase domain-containing protein [Mesorhizobium sp. Cs1299R1N3]|uniref:diguanylate cyclase domain-containing protein n=1 Tax=Mesorhizobium sp. Cs1299R1N3 TaxID=3015173 RepID=UPI003FA5CD5D